jgi:tetratricopeptide (TPR) repeat protein
MVKINRGIFLFTIVIVLSAAFFVRSAYGEETAKDLFAKGLFLFNNGDISDLAATEFQRVISLYPTADEAEDSLYFLASYHQRKFYIQKNRWREADVSILASAEQTYRDYITRYTANGSGKWLSDTYFNLMLIYIELGNSENALATIKELEGSKDKDVYIYQVVWSPETIDVIDYYYSNSELAQFLLSLLASQSPVQATADHSPQSLYRLITKWCQNTRSYHQSSER